MPPMPPICGIPTVKNSKAMSGLPPAAARAWMQSSRGFPESEINVVTYSSFTAGPPVGADGYAYVCAAGYPATGC